MRIVIPFCRTAFAIVAGAVALAAPGVAVDIHDTRLLEQPAVSAEHVAFVYADDLWVAGIDGSSPRRLTTHVGRETLPSFSPDGRSIAFSAQYDGNVDVYVVSVEGGVPRRLTWHPGPDRVQGFTPDGSAVLFSSPRAVYTQRYLQLFTVPVEGGFPTKLPIPYAFKATYSPDGSKIAYVPLSESFHQWKGYRGGWHSWIWIYDVADHSVVKVPQPAGRANDTDPMWLGAGDGSRIYFRSDRNGEFNLYSYDLDSGAVTQLTDHRDFPVLAARAGGGRIVYEQAGWLHLLDSATGTSSKLTLGVAADLIETRPRYAKGSEFIRNVDISPSGARAVFEFRGEIVTVPAEKGDPRNLTQSVGAHERDPAWSPDGTKIAYFSEASGEYRLVVAPRDGRGEAKSYELGGAGFYEDPKWSPDGEKLSFTDNSWSLYWIDLDDGAVTKVSSEPVYGPVKTLHHAWSPDSKWIAYTRNTPVYFDEVHLYSLAEERSHRLTEGLADATEPVFDAGGKYLWFAASTDAGPVRQWFAQSNADMEISNSLYMAVLEAGEPSPFKKESDEEGDEDGDEEDGEEGEEGDSDGDDGDEGDGEEGDGGPVTVSIDFDGLAQRIVALPLEPAAYFDLRPGPAGTLYYRRAKRLGGPDEPTALARFDLESREEETLVEDVNGFAVSADTEKLLYSVEKEEKTSYFIVDAEGEIEPDKGRLASEQIEVRIDPRAEWRQIFDEAWRINRDYFYDPGMHGADWPAMRERYAELLPHLTTRADLNRVIRWMGSELSVGHHYLFGGDRLHEADTVPGGLLGADYEIDGGRYRFARVYGGLNWNPELRAPLTEPGVEVEAGEYLLAVDGVELTAEENLFSRFEKTAGKLVELEVGPNTDGSGSRTVEVVPIENETALRNRAWVEENLEKVEEATDGRVAYVYVPNTAGLGHTYFKRYFFPQAHKEAIIVDERHNGGGSVADYYIDILRRPVIAYWTTRYGAPIETPISSIQGPKVMLINETAGSGGDLLPWMFRKFDLGPLIGKRTWGGLVGILGFPVLMDGGVITAPNLAFWTPEEGYGVENVGVPPDIEVEMTPAEVIAGRDPQLERAIEVILQMLEESPPATPEPPPFPVRAGDSQPSGS